MPPDPPSFSMLCMLIVLRTIFTELSIRNVENNNLMTIRISCLSCVDDVTISCVHILYCMAQAPCNPEHSALVMTSDSPGNHEGLATPLDDSLFTFTLPVVSGLE